METEHGTTFPLADAQFQLLNALADTSSCFPYQSPLRWDRALGRVHVFRTDHKAFFSRTCRNSHSTLVSQVSLDVGLQNEVQAGSGYMTLALHYSKQQEGTELPWLGLASKKQDLLGTRNKMELHFGADLSSASDRFVNKVQNSRGVVGDHRNLPKWRTFVVNRGEKETSLSQTHTTAVQ